jgi:hypothetical protein
MDPKDRSKIRDNFDELVRLTKWNPMLEDCVTGNESLKKVLDKIRVSKASISEMFEILMRLTQVSSRFYPQNQCHNQKFVLGGAIEHFWVKRPFD